MEAATIVALIVCVPFYLFPPSDGKCFRSAASNLLPNEVPKCRVKCSTLTADQTSTDSTDGSVLDREETDDSSIASLLASVERNEKLLSTEDGTDQSSSSCTMVAVVSSDKPFLYLTKHICVALCAPRRNLSSHFFLTFGDELTRRSPDDAQVHVQSATSTPRAPNRNVDFSALIEWHGLSNPFPPYDAPVLTIVMGIGGS